MILYILRIRAPLVLYLWGFYLLLLMVVPMLLSSVTYSPCSWICTLSLAGLKPISSGQFLHPLTPCSRSMPGCTNPISLSELCFKIAKFNCFQGQLLSDLFPEICLSSFCSWRCLSAVAFVVFIVHLTFRYFLLCVVFQLFPVSVLHF